MICIKVHKKFRRKLGKAGVTAHQFADLIKMHRNSVTNCSQKGVVPSHLAVISVLMGGDG
jgi:CRISPR/Cas system-associated protein endoribonuclease Cas2